MKAVATTDFHFTSKQPKNRTDDFLTALLMKLEQIVQYVIENDIDVWLDSGDFFDTGCQSTELINAIAVRLGKLWEAKPDFQPIKAIPGNHLVKGNFRRSMKNCGLATLEMMGYLKLIKSERPVIEKETRLMMWHETVTKDKMPFPHKTFEQIAEKAKGKVSGVVCSHYHTPQGYEIVNGVHFIAPGSIARGKGSEKNLRRIPQFAVIELEPNEINSQMHIKQVEFIDLKCPEFPFIEEEFKSTEDVTDELVVSIRKTFEDFIDGTMGFNDVLSVMMSKTPDINPGVEAYLKEKFKEIC